MKTKNNQYILKPAIRSIVENEAGWIHGTVPAGATVYAYKDGAYVEGTEPITSSDHDNDGTLDPAFRNAYASTIVKSDGTFKLAFLEAGTYDLVLVQGTQGPKFFDNNFVVESNKGTNAGDLAF